MKLPLLSRALQAMDGYKESGDGTNCTIRCPFCGGSSSDTSSLSIKIDIQPGEPLWYQCFRASCGKKGAITSTSLQEMGITNMDVLMEVARHNSNIGDNFDKPFYVRDAKNFVTVNLPINRNKAKLKYINERLGTKLTFQDLSLYKIQLSLFDLLRQNNIRRLSVKQSAAEAIDEYCIGFISMYNDYMICRDITPDKKTGMRYYTYRISGKPDPEDLKIYAIPREIDIMDPKSAVINVAEGIISILGAYLNTDLGCEKPNSLWAANCGSQYENTIIRLCKQYGLVKCRINIWSDSEIKIGFYRKLYTKLKDRLDIRRFTVYYNDGADDFGHKRENIKIREVTLYHKGGNE